MSSAKQKAAATLQPQRQCTIGHHQRTLHVQRRPAPVRDTRSSMLLRHGCMAAWQETAFSHVCLSDLHAGSELPVL